MTIRRLIAIIRAILICIWPAAILAAPLTFGQAVEQVTGFEWVLVLVLTTLAGVTALLIKISGIVNDTPIGLEVPAIRNPYLLVSAHMFGSWLAGLMAFFVASHYGMNGLLVGFFVPGVAFGGAKSCELFYNNFIKKKVGS